MGVLIGDLMAMAETQEWRARDAAWWRSLTNKRRGEMAEAAFLHKASSLGFGVSKPWGDSEPYDLIVDSGSGLWRGQVKSSYRADREGGYTIKAHRHQRKKAHTPKESCSVVGYNVPGGPLYLLPG